MSIEYLQERLAEAGDRKTKERWEAYLKNSLPFRGLKLPQVRAILHSWIKTENFSLVSLVTRLCLVTQIPRLCLALTIQQTLDRHNGKKQIQSNKFRQPTALCHLSNYQLDSCIMSSINSTNSLKLLKFYAAIKTLGFTRLRADGKSLAFNRHMWNIQLVGDIIAIEIMSIERRCCPLI